MIILQSNESLELEKKQVELLINKRVDGIIMSLSNESNYDEHIKGIINRNIPFVMFDKIAKLTTCSKVIINDQKAAFNATQFFNQWYDGEGYPTFSVSWNQSNNVFYLKSWWGTQPVLHIMPHWNWSGMEGKKIDVWVHSNCDEVELFLNKKSLGKKKITFIKKEYGFQTEDATT